MLLNRPGFDESQRFVQLGTAAVFDKISGSWDFSCAFIILLGTAPSVCLTFCNFYDPGLEVFSLLGALGSGRVDAKIYVSALDG